MTMHRRQFLATGGLTALGALAASHAAAATGQVTLHLTLVGGIVYVVRRDAHGRRVVDAGFPRAGMHKCHFTLDAGEVVRFDPNVAPVNKSWDAGKWEEFGVAGAAGPVSIPYYGGIPGETLPNAPGGWRSFGYVPDLAQLLSTRLQLVSDWQSRVSRLSLRGGTLYGSHPSDAAGLDSIWEFSMAETKAAQPITDTSTYLLTQPGNSVTIRVAGLGDFTLAPPEGATTIFASLAGEGTTSPPCPGNPLKEYEHVLALLKTRVAVPVRRLAAGRESSCGKGAFRTPGRFCPGLQVAEL